MKLRFPASIAAAALVVGCSGLLSADAAELQEAGWWERAPLGLPASVPRDVPEGGLVVASDPSGGAAVSAVRFDLEPDEQPLVLTLQIEQATGATPAVVACAATGRWAAAHGGAWDDRPAADCERGSVLGIFSEDATVVSFVLDALTIGTTFDVVLLPEQHAATHSETPSDPSVFELVLSPPTVGAITTNKVATNDNAALPSAETDARTTSADGGRSPLVPTTPPTTPGPRRPATNPTPAHPSEQVLLVDGPDTPPTLPTEAAREVALPPHAANGSGETIPRLLAALLVVLSLAAACQATIARNTRRPWFGLGHASGTLVPGAGSERELGVGRFRQPRSGQPPSIM